MTNQNYEELAKLYEKYSSKGLEVLAFPCNQFGAQEPGTNKEVQAFARAKGAKFPVFSKIDVNGPTTDPLFAFLKDTAPGGGLFLGLLGKGIKTMFFATFFLSLSPTDIKWNFNKFLVNGEGKVIKRFEPPQSPLSFESDIAGLL